MQCSVTQRLRRQASWELAGFLDTAQNNISFATWIERPWFHLKVLYNITLPTCLLLYFHLLSYPLFVQPKNKTCNFSQHASPPLLSQLLPYGPICLHPTYWSSLTTLRTLLFEWLVKTYNLRKEDDKSWPTHPVNRCMSIYIRHLWVMGLTRCVLNFYPFFSMLSSIHSFSSHSLMYVLSN